MPRDPASPSQINTGPIDGCQLHIKGINCLKLLASGVLLLVGGLPAGEMLLHLLVLPKQALFFTIQLCLTSDQVKFLLLHLIKLQADHFEARLLNAGLAEQNQDHDAEYQYDKQKKWF